MSDVMKKGQVYFSWLPVTVIAKWNKNVKNESERDRVLSTEYDSIYSFISDSFIWDQTPEGFDFWYNIGQIDWTL